MLYFFDPSIHYTVFASISIWYFHILLRYICSCLWWLYWYVAFFLFQLPPTKSADPQDGKFRRMLSAKKAERNATDLLVRDEGRTVVLLDSWRWWNYSLFNCHWFYTMHDVRFHAIPGHRKIPTPCLYIYIYIMHRCKCKPNLCSYGA